MQVFTAADLDLGTFGPPPLPGDRTRGWAARSSRGDASASSATSSRSSSATTAPTGVDAAELVYVDYDPLPVVVDPEDAAKDEVLLFPEAGTNVAARRPARPSTTRPVRRLRRRRLRARRQPAHGAVPARAALERAAEVGEDGRLTVWLSTQTPHQDRDALAGMLGLEPAQVRVVGPDVGGGFGAKMLSAEDVLVAWLARRDSAGRCAGPRRAARAWSRCRTAARSASKFTIGGTRDGKVLAYRLDVLAGLRRVPGARRVPRRT